MELREMPAPTSMELRELPGPTSAELRALPNPTSEQRRAACPHFRTCFRKELLTNFWVAQSTQWCAGYCQCTCPEVQITASSARVPAAAFGAICCLHLQFRPDDVGTMFPPSFHHFLPDYTVTERHDTTLSLNSDESQRRCCPLS
jgi:hypothetical protein